MAQDLVIYQFSRSRVEACEFKHLLDPYAPEKLPTGRRLRELMNSLTFVVEGFDDDPREIHSLPEGKWRVRNVVAAVESTTTCPRGRGGI
jgi:hypothetical protein